MIAFPAKRTTLIGPYYASFMQKLRTALETGRCSMMTTGARLLQDNAPQRNRSRVVVRTEVLSYSHEILSRPLLSPYLATSDVQLCLTMKSFKEKLFSH